MKRTLHSFPMMVAAAWLAIADPSLNANNSAVLGVFAGTTPCGQMIRPFHKVTQEADCAMVEWRLTLYQDPANSGPTTYKLSSVNRFIVVGTNMYSQPGTKSETEGKWSIVHGTKTNPRAIVYRLDTVKQGISFNFLKISDNLLHLLDPDGNLVIGDDAFSYTLNRVTN